MTPTFWNQKNLEKQENWFTVTSVYSMSLSAMWSDFPTGQVMVSMDGLELMSMSKLKSHVN
jgi:hypothetical protein